MEVFLTHCGTTTSGQVSDTDFQLRRFNRVQTHEDVRLVPAIVHAKLAIMTARFACVWAIAFPILSGCSDDAAVIVGVEQPDLGVVDVDSALNLDADEETATDAVVDLIEVAVTDSAVDADTSEIAVEITQSDGDASGDTAAASEYVEGEELRIALVEWRQACRAKVCVSPQACGFRLQDPANCQSFSGTWCDSILDGQGKVHGGAGGTGPWGIDAGGVPVAWWSAGVKVAKDQIAQNLKKLAVTDCPNFGDGYAFTPVPTLGSGAACQEHMECKSGACAGSGKCKHCAVASSKGDPCGSDAACEYGLVCASKKCAAAPVVGQPCSGEQHCAPGNWCKGGTVCAAAKAPGEACSQDNECGLKHVSSFDFYSTQAQCVGGYCYGTCANRGFADCSIAHPCGVLAECAISEPCSSCEPQKLGSLCTDVGFSRDCPVELACIPTQTADGPSDTIAYCWPIQNVCKIGTVFQDGQPVGKYGEFCDDWDLSCQDGGACIPYPAVGGSCTYKGVDNWNKGKFGPCLWPNYCDESTYTCALLPGAGEPCGSLTAEQYPCGLQQCNPCNIGLYCDPISKVCLTHKQAGEACVDGNDVSYPVNHACEDGFVCKGGVCQKEDFCSP